MRYRILIIAVGCFLFCRSARCEQEHDSTNYIWDSLYVEGDTVYATDIGKPFTKDMVQSHINDILLPLSDNGYYYATVKLKDISFRTNDHVVVTVTLSKGPRVRIAQQIYTGLTRSKKATIAKYIPAHTGDTLTDGIVADIGTSARAIDFVRFVPPVLIQPREGYMKADLALRFEERQPVTLALGGGYIPGDETGLVWHINLTLNNLFGGGRYATFLSERRERGRNQLEMGYRQPLFLVGVGKLHFKVATRDYRNEYYEFAIQTGYSVRLKQHISSGVRLSLRSVEPADDLPSYAVYTVRYGVNWHHIVNRYNPMKGLYLDWAIDYSYRRYRIDTAGTTIQKSSFTETRTTLFFKWYYPIVADIVGHVGITYLGLETGEALPPPSELILVGGPGTLRGFRNEQFAVLRAAIGTIEPRYRFADGYVFLFIDIAYLNDRVSDEIGDVRTDEQYQYGYGIGLALNNNSKYLKLSLGWSKELAFDSPRLSIELVTDL